MSIQELYDFMIYSREWQLKERLFAEAFPAQEDRVVFFSAFANRIIDEYEARDESLDDLTNLHLRKLAIERWFSRIPASLLPSLQN